MSPRKRDKNKVKWVRERDTRRELSEPEKEEKRVEWGREREIMREGRVSQRKRVQKSAKWVKEREREEKRVKGVREREIRGALFWERKSRKERVKWVREREIRREESICAQYTGGLRSLVHYLYSKFLHKKGQESFVIKYEHCP